MSKFEGQPIRLRAMGFCGVDDSVSPELLQLISMRYQWVEWGVLFRSDLEGQPRYPTKKWIDRLSAAFSVSSGSMQLAGHLCADRCQAILAGDSSFVKHLFTLGFRRVQVNATAANSVTVDSDKISEYVSNIKQCMRDVAEMEWIIQCNDETRPIWEQLVRDSNPSPNMSILYDASCGKGVRVTNFPSPATYPSIPCGYAGGIGPSCIREILAAVHDVTNSSSGSSSEDSGGVRAKGVWVDMESSLRVLVSEVNNPSASADKFSVDKCFECILAGCDFGLPTAM